MPSQTEPTVNVELGNLLRGMMGTCGVRSEHTGLIADQPGAQVDNLITAPGRSPVAVEAEFMPAYTAQQEAADRLGKHIAGQTRPVESAIALRYPAELKSATDLGSALREAQLSYCVLYDEGDFPPSRFPESGWLDGQVEDLADLVRLVAMPRREVMRAANSLEAGIARTAGILDEMNKEKPAIVRRIADHLGMRNVPQTRRMACAIVANALVFHERIAGIHDDVRPLTQVCGPNVANRQEATLAAWRRILEINYYPIFAIAKNIVEELPAGVAGDILNIFRETAQQVDATGVDNAHDLTGRIFQRLIADRKYLATFYTLPTSAALLARLAIAKLQSVDWSDPDAVGKLRVADFACGTGALLSAAYDQIAARHERAGGDPAALHQVMMEEVLYGCDVMPSAVHITGATLAGAHPDIGYQQSRLYTPRFGRQEDGTVRIGSLELLKEQVLQIPLETTDPALRTGSTGEDTSAHLTVEIEDDGFDLVIMNPPFTRATNHEGGHAEVVNPAFAAFDATSEDQTEMGQRINELARKTCYHGNSGIASAFAALAHRKLKSGGVLAMVLPLTVASGLSWQRFRNLLATDYSDLTVLSIAAAGDTDMAFSSDTGIAECLVIARRAERPQDRNLYVSLDVRPQQQAQSHVLAAQIIDGEHPRSIEDGPFGGTPVYLGEDVMAEKLSVTSKRNSAWSAVRIADYAVAQTAAALQGSRLWLQGAAHSLELELCELSQLATLGKVDRDITGPRPRGPFDKQPAHPTATFPALWSHDHNREKRMLCSPDSQLLVRQGMEEKATAVWESASYAHISRGFRFNSQSLAVAFTDEKCVGGRAWPNVKFDDKSLDYAFAVWGNTSLGLVCYWWHSNRQVSGRGEVTIRTAESLPVLDFRKLSDDKLQITKDIFEDFRERDLQPAYLADADPNRAHLDRRVVCDLLGFDQSVYEGVRRLAAKWCAEPSVHGGKARPPDASFVI